VTSQAPPKVFIVGGGFAGIAAARALAGTPVDLRLIDRFAIVDVLVDWSLRDASVRTGARRSASDRATTWWRHAMKEIGEFNE
jgi:2-polyprenyl-6-methoxyphenol hydroxylase-like FAD-dependent oxidoreductase